MKVTKEEVAKAYAAFDKAKAAAKAASKAAAYAADYAAEDALDKYWGLKRAFENGSN